MTMSAKEKLVGPKLPVLAQRRLVTILLVAFFVLQMPSGEIWQSVNLFAMIQREEVNLVGYVAASLVLATFCMRSMGALRLIALISNFAFIAYGYLAGLMPVLILHVVLLPVNAFRLLQLTGFDFRPRRRGDEQSS